MQPLVAEDRVVIVVDPLIKDRLAEDAECRSNTVLERVRYSASGVI